MENDEMVFPFLRKGKNKPYFCVVIFLQSLIPVSRNKKKADDRTRTEDVYKRQMYTVMIPRH